MKEGVSKIEFVRMLKNMLNDGLPVQDLLNVPSIYKAVAEYYHDDVIQAIEKDREYEEKRTEKAFVTCQEAIDFSKKRKHNIGYCRTEQWETTAFGYGISATGSGESSAKSALFEKVIKG